jgi:DNA-directed RNA polymerase subunit beta
MTPEEKLLRAIFGEKASDVRDTSLRVPPGVTGTVVEVRVFNRHGVEKDERAMAIEREEIERLAKDRDDEQAILDRNVYGRLPTCSRQGGDRRPEGLQEGHPHPKEVLDEYPRSQWWQFAVEDDKLMAEIEACASSTTRAKKALEQRFIDKVEKLQRGDELPPGVMKMVKVFVAVKRKIQPGDKMAGRHGNKGVVSRIVPIEDMPFLEDGTHVDIVLNPLGVPSRMNVGQILETHLGWACAGLGKQDRRAVDAYSRAATSSRCARAREDLRRRQERAGRRLDDESIVELGEQPAPRRADRDAGVRRRREKPTSSRCWRRRVSTVGPVDALRRTHRRAVRPQGDVGYIYMLKLHHLVDDKIHARSIGPYSLVTQQPLGGKAQFGGQRFGEMEVWALEAYGAAYTLQEMLTVKSDDVAGRTKVYEAIVRGDDTFEAGIPESFNVLVKEMRSLGLNVELTTRSARTTSPSGRRGGEPAFASDAEPARPSSSARRTVAGAVSNLPGHPRPGVRRP